MPAKSHSGTTNTPLSRSPRPGSAQPILVHEPSARARPETPSSGTECPPRASRPPLKPASEQRHCPESNQRNVHWNSESSSKCTVQQVAYAWTHFPKHLESACAETRRTTRSCTRAEDGPENDPASQHLPIMPLTARGTSPFYRDSLPSHQERSRTDTRDAQGPGIRSLRAKSARGRTREMLKAPGIHCLRAKSARGRTRETLKAPGISSLHAKSARGRTREMLKAPGSTAFAPGTLADGTRAVQDPGNRCFNLPAPWNEMFHPSRFVRLGPSSSPPGPSLLPSPPPEDLAKVLPPKRGISG